MPGKQAPNGRTETHALEMMSSSRKLLIISFQGMTHRLSPLSCERPDPRRGSSHHRLPQQQGPTCEVPYPTHGGAPDS